LLVIDEIEVLDFTLPVLKIRVVCSKGTYIRALARDICLALGSGAHLIGLERTRIGEVRLENCWQIDDLIKFLDKSLALPDEKIGIN
jgi:tRNA pseudouridine55 synthase